MQEERFKPSQDSGTNPSWEGVSPLTARSAQYLADLTPASTWLKGEMTLTVRSCGSLSWEWSCLFGRLFRAPAGDPPGEPKQSFYLVLSFLGRANPEIRWAEVPQWASPEAGSKCIARVLLHFGCLGWKGRGNLMRCLGQAGKWRLRGYFLLRKRLMSNRSNYVISLFYGYIHLFKKSVILLYQSCNDYLMSGCLWSPLSYVNGGCFTAGSPHGFSTGRRAGPESLEWGP